MDHFFENKEVSSDEDFYKLLGCDERSSEEQISTEFKRLARKYHPDKASSEEDKVAAEKMFMKIERAKEVLLNKEKRAKYDLWRTGGFKNVMSFEKWYEMQGQVLYSMHWVVPTKTVPAITEASQSEGLQGNSGDKDQQSTEDHSSQPAAKPTSLDEFRRGGQKAGCQLNSFRNYNL